MSTASANPHFPITAELSQLVSQGADAARIGAEVASAWQEIDACLNPVIGTQGVAALYLRSLAACLPAHPWLDQAQNGIELALDCVRIRQVLAGRSATESAAGGGAVLEAFWALLADMVGPALTQELLGSVWSRVLNKGADSAKELS
jgi:hypothetical protein